MSYSGTYLVWGPPGTGKTTWLSTQVRKIAEESPQRYADGTPCLVCSLTRTAAAEVAGRDLPIPYEAVGTLHAMAYRVMDRPEVAEARLTDWNEWRPKFAITAGGPPIDMDESGPDQPTGRNPGDELMGQYSLLRSRMTPREIWPGRVREFAAAWEPWKAVEGLVDFTDMIDVALHEYPNYPPGGPDVIIADEAQDHSALEYSLLLAWGKAAGALILTGDPYQALYVWRGAHPELFTDPAVLADHRRVLTQSYRVPRAVHAKAMSWVKQLSVYDDLDYKPRDHPGEILTSQATWRHPDTAVMTAEAMLEAGKSVMFAASCGYMLFPLIAMLRDRGIPFANPWRTRHGGWNPLGKRRGVTASMRLLAFLRPDYETHGSEARQWTNEELGQWASVMTAKGTIIQGAKKVLAETAKVEPDLLVELATLLARFEAAPITELLDMFRLRDPMTDPPPGAERPTVQMLAAWWTGRMQGSKLQAVDYPVRILSTAGADVLMKPPRCFVGTIHSFKGSEADCVFLFPDLSNAGYEEWRAAGKSRDGVIRLMYVGMTRARETLVLCRRAGSTGVEW